MVGGINLHRVVRQVIPSLHPDESIFLFLSTGSANIRGIVTQQYKDPISLMAQIQSFTNNDLMALNEEARTKVQRKAYLFSENKHGLIPEGILRTAGRGGDIIQRADKTWWLIAGMVEDFSHAGWVAVRIVEQVEVPAHILSYQAST